MFFTVRNTTSNLGLIKEMHDKCFPGEEFYEHKKNFYWIAMDGRGTPLGFGLASDFGHGILFLSRAGVLAKYRGQGLHKRIIGTRIRFARRRNYKCVVTYTARENHASANNLIECGFRAFSPELPWVGNNFNYWMLEL